MASGLTVPIATNLIYFCETLEEISNPFCKDGRSSNSGKSRSELLSIVTNSLRSDPNGHYAMMTPTQIENALTRILVEIPISMYSWLMDEQKTPEDFNAFDLLKVTSCTKGKKQSDVAARDAEKKNFNSKVCDSLQKITAYRVAF